MKMSMTSAERFRRVFGHQQPDRVPILDSPWESTWERWRKEGYPEGADPADFFGWDRVAGIKIDNSPRYPVRVVEETAEYKIQTTAWGTTLKTWKSKGGVPEFEHFTITDPDSWRQAKKRMTPDPARIDWDKLKADYPKWKQQGAWIVAGGWFGYDVFASWIVGYERVLMAMIEDPEWCQDMFRTALELDIAMMEMLLARGYAFDCFTWPDDLGYRNGLLFSLDTYRRVSKPVHKQAIDWCHAHGIKAHMHSCGNIMALTDDLVEIGLDGLNPLEVKAGMDAIALKHKYGDKLVLEGGIDVRTWNDPAKAEQELRQKLPILMKSGGYIFHSDHSIPETISLREYQYVLEVAKRLGTY
jgi:uroporphyrinogen decarboxylase